MKNASIAILFFSRSAEAEASLKQWTRNKEHDRVIAESLRTHTLYCLQRTGLPFFEFSEKEQVGQTFAERLQNAFADVFSKGFTHVVALGSDLPSIGELDWETIQTKLLSHDVLLGPDHRGGVYLFGLTDTAFRNCDFDKLHWQSGNLLQTLELNFPQAVFLEIRADLNSRTDLQLAFQSGIALMRYIIANINTGWANFRKLLFGSYDVLIAFNTMRGPPELIVSV